MSWPAIAWMFAMQAVRKLQASDMHIDETSSSRADLMPCGGTKGSPHLREGQREAIQEMSEMHMVNMTV